MDRSALDLSNDIRSGWLDDLAEAITVFGSLFVVAPVALGAAVALGARRRWTELAVLVAGMFVIVGMTDAIKEWTERPRPPDPLVEVSGYSFPSGHAAYATIYTWLATTVAFRTDTGITRRGLLIGAGVGVTAVIGLTRGARSPARAATNPSARNQLTRCSVTTSTEPIAWNAAACSDERPGGYVGYAPRVGSVSSMWPE